MDHQVRPVLDRSEQGRAEERVVGDDEQPAPMAELGDRIDVGDAQARVRRGLEEQRLRRGRDRRLDRGEVRHVDARDADPKSREVLVEQHLRDHEQLVADDDVVPEAQMREEGRRDGRHAGRRDDPVLGALDRGDLLLQRPVRRVARARVEVDAGLPREGTVDRVFLLRRGVERVGRGREDRGLWAWVTGSGRSPAWIARVAKPRPSVRSRIGRRLRGVLDVVAGKSMGRARPAWVDPRAVPLPGGPHGLVGTSRATADRATRGPLDPGRRARVRGPVQGPLARRARRAIRSGRLAHRPYRPRSDRLARPRDRGVRGGVSGLPARPARPRPVPDDGLRQRLRRQHQQRPRR